MREITLEATIRKQYKKHTKSLRRVGTIPGVFYLHGEENISISVLETNLKPLIYTAETHVINLKLDDGKSKSCILRDIQFDPVTDRPVHFDLQGLRENEEITIEAPIVLTGGVPIGVREGGILQQVIYEIKISCLPKFIPEQIEIDVASLKLNNFIHVSDLTIQNVTILENSTSSIVGVVPPAVEKEPEPGEVVAEEAVEPEVISKGKKPEEGEEAEETGEKKPGEKKTAEKKPETTKAAPPAKEEKK
jgi:large subunit ribosomal protein L25